MPTSLPNDRTRVPALAWLLLGLSAVWCVVWFAHARGYWEDDAYIHLEFARSVAEGRGFSFNGRVVYGDTSPLWVWLLAAFHAVIPEWMAAGKTLTWFAAVFALSGAFAFAYSLTRERMGAAASAVFAAAMVALFVANPYFGYWAFSGMEALAAAGLACWAAVIVGPRQLSAGRFLLGCVAGGVAPLLRPEMGFFTVLLGLVLLERLRQMDGRRRVGLFVAGLVVMAAPFLLWARYAVRTFGTVLPNTNAAKRAAPGDSVVLHLVRIYGLGFPVILIALALLAGWYVLRGRREEGVGGLLHAGGWLMLAWTAINCVFYVADHTYVQTRYIFVTAPVLTIALLAIVVQRWPRVYRGLLVFGLGVGVAVSGLSTWPLIRNKVQVDRVYAELAAFLKTLPADAPVAHYSIGEAAFLSGHPLIDTGGITRPGIIPYLFDANDDRRLAWVEAQGGQYMVEGQQPTPGATLVWKAELPTTGWFLNPRMYGGVDTIEVWKLPGR
jgi:hypothetical protein